MVDNVNAVGGAGGNIPAHKLKAAYQPAASAPAADSVEISAEVMRLKGVEGIRLDKVMEVRKAVREGTYLTAAKLDKALDRAIDDAHGARRTS